MFSHAVAGRASRDALGGRWRNQSGKYHAALRKTPSSIARGRIQHQDKDQWYFETSQGKVVPDAPVYQFPADEIGFDEVRESGALYHASRDVRESGTRLSFCRIAALDFQPGYITS
jgi:hypothetical protein